mgnify:FL=1
MKKTTIMGAALLVVLTFSCKKDECKECHYDKNGAEIELGEKCGDDITSLEANGYTENGVNYTVHCGEGH